MNGSAKFTMSGLVVRPVGLLVDLAGCGCLEARYSTVRYMMCGMVARLSTAILHWVVFL